MRRMISEAIDKLFASIAPEYVAKRAIARAKIDAVRSAGNIIARAGVHKGAQGGRFHRWFGASFSADDDNIDDAPVLRERTRELVRDNGLARGASDTLVNEVVGAGIQAKAWLDREALGIDDHTADNIERRMDAIWRDWIETADITGRNDFYGLQRLAFRQKVENGDYLVLIRRKDRLHARLSTCLQLIEADRLESPIGINAGEKDIRGGVEINEDGEPVNYYVLKYAKGALAQKSGIGKYMVIPARDSEGRPVMIHDFRVDRPGQSRGVSWFSPVLDLFKHLEEYKEAELVAARVAACFAVFVKRSNSYDAALGSIGGIETRSDGTTRNLEALEPGMIEYLNENEDITTFSPQRPGAMFDPFVNALMRDIAKGLNLPFELISGNWQGASYSVARTVLLEARRGWKADQIELGRSLVQPVYRIVIEEAWLRGLLPDIPNFNENSHLWTSSRLIPQGWHWVDPEKEINAAGRAIELGLSSLSHESATQGRDWEEVLEQRAREEKRKRDLGIVDRDKVIAHAEKLYGLGIHLSQSELYRVLGFAEPDAAEQSVYSEGNFYEYHMKYGVLTINEVRERLNLPSVEWGNEPLRPIMPTPLSGENQLNAGDGSI